MILELVNAIGVVVLVPVCLVILHHVTHLTKAVVKQEERITALEQRREPANAHG